ncbi:hypothetical protein PHMEG_00029444 [Phytophthora megakarya]|uniref:Reverse transcriptase n=1 Tax=Phytophthora megakarya TaxID=4795 RepID=A0A225V460_9STRA|nr:hypothetical protein PHMEG_00029444 [Phytophthora megakarya]
MQEEFSLRQTKLHMNVPRRLGRQLRRKVLNFVCICCWTAEEQGKQRAMLLVRKHGSLAGRPTGNAVTRVYNGHAVLRTAAPSERESHCKVQVDMPNLVILKVKSMTNRADSLRVLVDSGGASNNFIRQQSLPLLDFEEKHVPRSQLEVNGCHRKDREARYSRTLLVQTPGVCGSTSRPGLGRQVRHGVC